MESTSYIWTRFFKRWLISSSSSRSRVQVVVGDEAERTAPSGEMQWTTPGDQMPQSGQDTVTLMPMGERARETAGRRAGRRTSQQQRQDQFPQRMMMMIAVMWWWPGWL